MGIPNYQEIMLPLLKSIVDVKTYHYSEITEKLLKEFKLTDKEKEELLPSGQQTIFENRIGWAKTYLKKAGLINSEKKGTFFISKKGIEVINQKLDKIDNNYLKQIPEFKEFFYYKKSNLTITDNEDIDSDKTPEELLEYTYQNLRKYLVLDLLDIIKKNSYRFFENLVIDLLIKLGYGGSKKEAGESIGRSGDEGIDGIIKEDKLGLDFIYIQAKKWDNQVPIKEVRDFAGALLGKKSKKGIFITTSSFPDSAYEYIKSIDHKIILINGEMLANLMIDYNIGIEVQKNYEIKKIDTDYFIEE